jgi:hypothetical protein
MGTYSSISYTNFTDEIQLRGYVRDWIPKRLGQLRCDAPDRGQSDVVRIKETCARRPD